MKKYMIVAAMMLFSSQAYAGNEMSHDESNSPKLTVPIIADRNVDNDIVDFNFTVKSNSMRGNADEAKASLSKSVNEIKEAIKGKYLHIRTLREWSNGGTMGGGSAVFHFMTIKLTLSNGTASDVMNYIKNNYPVKVQSVSSRLSKDLYKKTIEELFLSVLDKAKDYRKWIIKKNIWHQDSDVVIYDINFADKSKVSFMAQGNAGALSFMKAMPNGITAAVKGPENTNYETGVTPVSVAAIVVFRAEKP